MRRQSAILPFDLPRLSDQAAAQFVALLHELIKGIDYQSLRRADPPPPKTTARTPLRPTFAGTEPKRPSFRFLARHTRAVPLFPYCFE